MGLWVRFLVSPSQVNLTIADLMMSTLNCIPSFIFMRDRVWVLGSLYCSVNNFVSNLTVSSSVFTLLAISVDRHRQVKQDVIYPDVWYYRAIMHPLARHRSRSTVLFTIGLIWAASAAIAAPAAVFSKTVQLQPCSDRVACILVLITAVGLHSCMYCAMCVQVWSDGYQGDSMKDHL